MMLIYGGSVMIHGHIHCSLMVNKQKKNKKTQKFTYKNSSIFFFSFFLVDKINFNRSNILLVFHGLDTIATIVLNGNELSPKPNNMFVRYRYNVKDILKTV